MCVWGSNDYGLADPPDGNDFIAVAAGARHSLALKSDATIVGWGANYHGQAEPPDGNDFVAIAAGDNYGLALKSDGSVARWGVDAGMPNPTTDADLFAASVSGTDIVAKYSGGTTDYTAGSLTLRITAYRTT